MIKLVPIGNPKTGAIDLYDIFLGSVWIGSRRTVEQAHHEATNPPTKSRLMRNSR